MADMFILYSISPTKMYKSMNHIYKVWSISSPMFLVAPEWVLEPVSLEVAAGEPVRIPCSAFGIPKPTVTWIRIGQS